MAGLTTANPVTFEQALASVNVLAGDTIVLMPGNYGTGKGKFTPEMWIGTEAKPITLKPQIAGTVVLNGGLELLENKAAHVIVKDLEIGPTPTERVFADYGSVDYPPSVYVTAPGCKIVGNYLRNGMNGLAMFGTGSGVIAENIFGGVGFVALDGDHGTNIYTHNHFGGQIDILHNLFGACFGSQGVDLWSATINNVRDYYVRENVIIGRRLMVGGLSGLIQNNRINDNHIALSELRLGLGGANNKENNGALEVLRNRQWGDDASMLFWCQNAANVQDNVFCKQSAGAPRIGYYRGANESNVVGGNFYYKNDAVDGVQDYDNGTLLSIAEWQGLGYDTNSQFLNTLPTTNEIFVYPFTFSDWRVGMVVVWNWENSASVSVDLSLLSLTNGNTYRWRQGQDLENDTGTFVYDGNPVNFSMQNHTIVIPTAHDVALEASTFPTFGAFVLERA